MKFSHKKAIIGLFLFMDLLVCGFLMGKPAIKNATRRLFIPEATEDKTIEDSMIFVNEGIATVIEYTVTTEEDLAVAQEIIMNEQQELILEQNKISQAIITSNKKVEAAKQAKIKAAQEKKRKEQAAKLAEQRRKQAEEDAKQLQIALANEAKAAEEAKQKTQVAATQSNQTSNAKSNTTTTTTTTKKTFTGYDVASYALKFNGKGYVMGGQWNGEMPYTPTDCSGFTMGVYKHFGITIPRVARDQAKVGREVALKDIQPGDLVFYSGNGGYSVTHAAMYIGNGQIIHAQTPYLGIGISNIKLGTLIRTNIRRVI